MIPKWMAMAAWLILPLVAADAEGQRKLQRAIDLMQNKGDLPAAVRLFNEVSRSNDRPVAARALLYLAQCQEQQGKEQAQATYRRIAKDFADQAEIATRARERLTALGTGADKPKGLTARQLWTGTGVDSGGMPTADGRLMAFTHWDTGDIAIRDIATGEVKRLMQKESWTPNAAFAEWPVLSADERQVVYTWWDAERRFYQLRMASTQPKAKPITLLEGDASSYFVPVGWSADGKSTAAVVYGQSDTAIAWISVPGGTVTPVRKFEWQEPNASLSPDGRWIAYDVRTRRDSAEREIHIVRSDGQGDQTIARSAGSNRNPVWTPDGRGIVFLSDRSGSASLWTIDIRDGKADATAKLLKPDVGWITIRRISRQGTLFYFHSTGDFNVASSRIDSATGKAAEAQRLADSFVGRNKGAAWSPDGESIAYISVRGTSPTEFGSTVLVVRHVESGKERVYPQPFQAIVNDRPIWTHDGKQIVQMIRDRQDRRAYTKMNLATGERTEIPVAVPPGISLRPGGSLSKDDSVLYSPFRDENGSGVLTIDLASGKHRVLYRRSNKNSFVMAALASPADDTVAVAGDRQLLILDPAGKPGNVLATGNVLNFPLPVAWSADGKYLYFVHSPDGVAGPMEVVRIPVAGGSATPTGLSGKRISYLSLHPKGTAIAYTTGQNFIPELWSLEGPWSRPATE